MVAVEKGSTFLLHYPAFVLPESPVFAPPLTNCFKGKSRVFFNVKINGFKIPLPKTLASLTKHLVDLLQGNANPK